MSSRHHIDDLYVAELLKDRRRAKNNRCCQGSSTSLTALFDGCGSHLKLLECVVDGTGGSVRSTTPAEDRYIVLSAKRNRRTTAQQLANQFLAASGKQISRKTVARRLRGRRTIRTQTCCVCPIDQTAPYCPFAMVS
ncbi:hypothetical protein TNCV_1930261 [Trichonephila clavipes]|nr:hypothetical protein TNCV_1930261 [Trichonephila clavipes]